MRRLLFLLIVLGCTLPATAQQETLISGDVSFGGFGGPTLAVSGINAELNVTTFFRMSAGLTYRFVSGIDLAEINDNELSGINGIVMFKFGGF